MDFYFGSLYTLLFDLFLVFIFVNFISFFFYSFRSERNVSMKFSSKNLLYQFHNHIHESNFNITHNRCSYFSVNTVFRCFRFVNNKWTFIYFGWCFVSERVNVNVSVLYIDRVQWFCFFFLSSYSSLYETFYNFNMHE